MNYIIFYQFFHINFNRPILSQLKNLIENYLIQIILYAFTSNQQIFSSRNHVQKIAKYLIINFIPSVGQMKQRLEEKNKILLNSQPHLSQVSPSQYKPQQVSNFNEQKLRISCLNANLQSFMLIKAGHIESAIQLLEISQKQLQERLRNNKKMEDILMTATLHNLASAYQKLGNHSKALDKIRVLLHNVNTFMPKPHENQYESRISNLYQAGMTSRYYVYFLALTLQLNMIQASTIPANRMLQFYKKFFTEYRKSQLSITLINKRMTEDLLSDMEQIDVLIALESCEQIMDRIKESITKASTSSPSQQQTNLKIKKLSIQYLSTIFPLQLNLTETVVTEKNSRGKIFQNGLIEFALGLFLIGKSIVQSCKRYNGKDEKSHKITSLDKAKKYVLWAFYFSFQLCPHFTAFHRELFNYYQENFQQKPQPQKKKIKVIDSLQAPQLKNLGLWSQIKISIEYFTNQKEMKQLNKIQSDIELLLSQSKPSKFLSMQKIKNNSQKSNMKQSLNSVRSKTSSTKDFIKTEKKKFKINFNQIHSNEKDINIKKTTSKNKRYEKKRTTMMQEKSKSKRSKNTKQKNSFAHSSSNQKYSLKKPQKLKTKDKNKKEQKLDLSIPINDYFPVEKKRIRVTHDHENISNSKQKKKIVKKILSLENKIKEGSKSLTIKQKELFKSIKNC